MTKTIYTARPGTSADFDNIAGWVGTDQTGARTWMRNIRREGAFAQARKNGWASCRPFIIEGNTRVELK